MAISVLQQYIRILGLLKSSKLEYLKAAEGQHPTEIQRFLHRQARLRHHFFQDLELQLRAQFQDQQPFHLAGIQMEQRLVASLQQSVQPSVEKCIELDTEIVNTLNKLENDGLIIQPLQKDLTEAISFLQKLSPKQKSKSSFWG